MPRAEIIDAAGTAHAPAGSEARIVSLVPSVTELLIDMGLGAQVVGRTHYCVHPADAVAAIPSVGGTKKIKMDRLAELAPTHVIVNIDENTRAMAREIGALGPAMVVTHPLAPKDNLALYQLMGGLFDREAEAARLSRAFDRALARLRAAADDMPPRDVVYWIWKDPWMTISQDTYVSRTLALVNWRTLCHDPETRYPAADITPDLLGAADIVLFATEPYAFTQEDVHAFARDYACGETKLAVIDGAYTQWYGSRAIAGLDYLANFAKNFS